MSQKQKLLASFDVEADGPCPATSNMVELGVSFILDTSGEEIDSFYTCIKRRDNYPGDESTIKWLKDNGVYSRAVDGPNVQEPHIAMTHLAEKIQTLSNSFVIEWVAWPAAYDLQWLKAYFVLYTDKTYHQLVSYTATCMSSAFKTYVRINKLSKDNENALWKSLNTSTVEHTHNALDDAREQGSRYINLLKLM